MKDLVGNNCDIKVIYILYQLHLWYNSCHNSYWCLMCIPVGTFHLSLYTKLNYYAICDYS